MGSGERRFELPHQQRRIVVSYCPKRADKDRHDREQSVQRLLKKIGKSQNPKSLLNNYGYKKFLTVSGKTRLSVNEEKIAQAARWDGLHGVITNLPKKISADELFSHYRGLWQVEETFRIAKHDLKIPKRYVIPSQFSPEAKKIYQLMGIDSNP